MSLSDTSGCGKALVTMVAVERVSATLCSSDVLTERVDVEES